MIVNSSRNVGPFRLHKPTMPYILPWMPYILPWMPYILPWMPYVLPWMSYILPWMPYVLPWRPYDLPRLAYVFWLFLFFQPWISKSVPQRNIQRIWEFAFWFFVCRGRMDIKIPRNRKIMRKGSSFWNQSRYQILEEHLKIMIMILLPYDFHLFVANRSNIIHILRFKPL